MGFKTGRKLSIKLESFSSELLTSASKKIVKILEATELNSLGIVSLPKKKRIYCVLRSPHVDKDSREHFEIRIHKKVIEIYYDSNSSVFEILSEINLPIGVFSTIYL